MARVVYFLYLNGSLRREPLLFEFDEQKSRVNKAKHGIDFVEAQRLWLDAHRLAVTDFPRPGATEPLTAEWISSRPPMEFFQRAAR